MQTRPEDNRNVAHMAVLLAGLPVSIAGNTVNRLCASGLQAIMDASRRLPVGGRHLYRLRCGKHDPRTICYGKMRRHSTKYGDFDSTIGWRFINPSWLNVLSFFHGRDCRKRGETMENFRIAQDEFISPARPNISRPGSCKWATKSLPWK